MFYEAWLHNIVKQSIIYNTWESVKTSLSGNNVRVLERRECLIIQQLFIGTTSAPFPSPPFYINIKSAPQRYIIYTILPLCLPW